MLWTWLSRTSCIQSCLWCNRNGSSSSSSSRSSSSNTFRTKRLSSRRSEAWFDREYCQFRRSTRRPQQRAYRRVRFESSLAEWRSHFHELRRVFRQKSEISWSTAIAGCHGDSKKLWSAIDFYNRLHHLERSTPRQTLLFTSPTKSRKFVRPPSTLRHQSSTKLRQSTTLANLVPVSVEEAIKLLKSAPNKHCQLDSIPTWILKKSADRFAPLFAALFNSSHSSGLPHLRNMPLRQPNSRKLR